jgi:hypothetical protein
MRDGSFVDETRLTGGTTGHLGALAGSAGSTHRNPLSVYDASVSLSLESGSVCGRRLPPGAAVGVQQALPAYVPGALRRARSWGHVDEDLQTTEEAGARQELADLEFPCQREPVRHRK